MTKTVKLDRTPTSFFLPADDLRAAFQCVSAEQTRYYLNGVFIDRDAAGLRLIGLDGHVMVKIELPDAAFVGEDCMTQENGFILKTDRTDKAFKAKTPRAELWLYGDTATGLLQFVAADKTDEPRRVGVCEFEQIDGTFPEWRRVMPKAQARAGHMCFDPAKLAMLVKAGDVLKKGCAVRLTSGEGVGDPMRVEYYGLDRMTGVLMPYRWSADA